MLRDCNIPSVSSLIFLLGAHVKKYIFSGCGTNIIEPAYDKSNKTTCEPSEDSDQPGHQPSLIRVFAVHSMGS